MKKKSEFQQIQGLHIASIYSGGLQPAADVLSLAIAAFSPTILHSYTTNHLFCGTDSRMSCWF